MKQKITEKDNVHQSWYESAKQQTLETLPAFLSHLMTDYEHDYGTICHAIGAGATATAYAMDRHEYGGITGFQSGAVMWAFIRGWSKQSNECGMKLLDYDNLCYPQYADEFRGIISSDTYEAVQKRCREYLEDNDRTMVHPNVQEYWRKIIEGWVPEGIQVI